MKYLALLLLGCGVQPTEYCADSLAMQIVWYQTYGQSYTPPSVEWVYQGSLNCNLDFDGDFDGFYHSVYYGGPSSGNCVWGVTFTNQWVIQVARPTEFQYSDYKQVFEHELWHSALYLTDPASGGDPDHKDPGFGPKYGHPPGGALDQAQEALKNAGL